MKTFIPSKDAALEDTIHYFQQQLSDLGFEIEVASWLNPVPYVWSVHIRDKHCGLCFTNGKGASKKAALASALGEYFERLATNYFFADFYLGDTIANSDFVHYPNEQWFAISDDNQLPAGILDDHSRRIYDHDGELTADMLIDLQSGNDDRGICALPFVRQDNQQVVYFPMNIIGNLYVSNGMSAGNSPTEARTQGLSETIERYIKNRIISERISLPTIPDTVMARYPHLQAAIATLEAEGFPIYVFDASLGGHYPVLCVVLFNPQNSTCFASFGAHPRFEVTLERTVTELLQGRGLNALDVFVPPSFDDDEVSDHHNLETHFIDSSGVISWDLFKETADYEFVDWDFSGSSEQEFAHLLAMFNQLNQPVYIADYKHLGVYCCRILVPGLSEIYPAEDLYLANNNMAAHLRATLLSLPSSNADAAQLMGLYELLEEEGLDDAARVRELLGIATTKGSAWHTLRIGELKGMLALAAGELELALEYADWTLSFNSSVFSEARCRYYRCLMAALALHLDTHRDPSQYRAAFSRLYTAETTQQVWQQIAGSHRFYGLTAADESLVDFPAHQALLAVYNTLQDAKRHWAQAGA